MNFYPRIADIAQDFLAKNARQAGVWCCGDLRWSPRFHLDTVSCDGCRRAIVEAGRAHTHTPGGHELRRTNIEAK